MQIENESAFTNKSICIILKGRMQHKNMSKNVHCTLCLQYTLIFIT
jgi:hypothetical protein